MKTFAVENFHLRVRVGHLFIVLVLEFVISHYEAIQNNSHAVLLLMQLPIINHLSLTQLSLCV